MRRIGKITKFKNAAGSLKSRVLLLLSAILLANFAFAPPATSIEKTAPLIPASVVPLKVRPCDPIFVSNPFGVSSVSTDVDGIETIPLSSGTAYAGILQAGGCNYG